ncbi:MAG: hypothetical protein SGJ27_29825 [Candidatus Melainabacteria bacterium]|nr:hypothetical protein [Candidatus Melainabacteria bacterium]
MVHQPSPEAGALRSASAPSNASEAQSILHGHATELMRHSGTRSYSSHTSGEATVGNTLSIPPISDVSTKTSLSDAAPSSTRNADTSPIKKLDSTKSVGDLAKDGTIADNTKAFGAMEREKAADGKAPTVKVQFSDVTAQPNKMPPDFVVKKDGSVTMNNNPEKTGQKDIVIEVERADGQLIPSESQQKAVDELYKYLDARIKTENPDAQKNGVKIDDPQNLVSPETEKATQAKSERQAPAELPPEAEAQTQRMNRFKGAGSGQMSRSEANDYFPERSVPRQKNENDNIAAMKDVVAGFTSKGDKAPYEHVSHRGSRGWGAGRYGMGYDQVADWLSNLNIENLEELERQGKVPKGTAAKMKAMKASVGKAKESGKDSDLDPFLQKMKAGDKNDPLTADDIKQNFGKEVQELAASHQIGRYSEELGAQNQSVQPGDLAFAMMTGRVPTAEDSANPESKRFMDAATQSYQIALNRFDQPNGPVDFADTGNLSEAMKDAVGKQLWRGYDGATQQGNLGCAITVSRILRAGGIDVGNELSVNGLADKMRQIGAEKTSLAEARESGKPYVIIKKQGGSHTGIAIGDTVVENSSSQRRTVARDLSQSSLKSGSYAYILPTKG